MLKHIEDFVLTHTPLRHSPNGVFIEGDRVAAPHTFPNDVDNRHRGTSALLVAKPAGESRSCCYCTQRDLTDRSGHGRFAIRSSAPFAASRISSDAPFFSRNSSSSRASPVPASSSTATTRCER